MYTCHAEPLIERCVSSIREKRKRRVISKCTHRMPESKPSQKQ